MIKKQFVIGAGTLAIVIGLAVGFTLSKHEPVVAEKVQDRFVPGVNTNATLEDLKVQMESSAQYEKAYGCMTKPDKFGQTYFCGDSKKKMDALQAQFTAETYKLELASHSPEDLAKAKDNIRALSGDPSIELKFEGTSGDLYSNSDKRIEYWSDPDKFTYLVDPTTNKVIQFGPKPNSSFRFDEKGNLTKAELRKIAEKYLFDHVADFDKVKSTFIYREASKSGTSYAFRWEAASRPKGEDLAPFVQVVLSPTGQIGSFNDTRSLYSNN